ncbi:PREDICTED: epidermal retinol dehydrogenase 2-like [Gekko japonicus]|uniref:Epidermal retinol dehydrogenase 2-like n=1 Tax=Gekko japonicus TaxID=146911 RepID=A0ABM1KAL3_GEKJA|nr:PREDICTED: epidermal retinol dehydrogenase 2-like [Gekko japonicus]
MAAYFFNYEDEANIGVTQDAAKPINPSTNLATVSRRRSFFLAVTPSGVVLTVRGCAMAVAAGLHPIGSDCATSLRRHVATSPGPISARVARCWTAAMFAGSPLIIRCHRSSAAAAALQFIGGRCPPLLGVKKEVGDVNILINNAVILNWKNFIVLTDSEMEDTLDLNIKAQFLTCKAFLPAMISCNCGHLVTISSTGALTGANALSYCCASKWAETGFLEAIAFELQAAGKKGIKTTIVFPYYVDTEMITGVQTTRPCLFPILDVGRSIVDAVLKEKFYLFIPSWVSFIPLKIFLPTKVMFLLAEYLGFFNYFDHFKGRKKIKENKI